jgi:Ca2+-binding EF-hand superfamily protein
VNLRLPLIAAWVLNGAAASAAPPGEVHDLLLLSETRPVVVRAHITHDGKPLADSWGRFADGVFAALDADKSGAVEPKELKRLNPVLSLVTGSTERLSIPARPMNRAELGDFLQTNGYGVLRVPQQNVPRNRGIVRGGGATPEELDKTLLALLDADKDGKLSVSELTAGAAILTKLDADENELLTTEEILQRQQSPFFVSEFGRGGPQPLPLVELLPLNRKGSDADVASRMVMRYGPKQPSQPQRTFSAPVAVDGPVPPAPAQPMPATRRLSKTQLKLADDAFKAFDQDGDGELDLEELGRIGQNAIPEIEIVLRLGTLPPGMKAVEVIQAGKSPVKASIGPRPSEVAIEVPGIRLDLIASPIATGAAFRSAFRSRYLGRFLELDRDGDGYLTRDESAGDPTINEHFTTLDRDGNGKLYESEIVAALDEAESVAAAATQGVFTLELKEMGRGLFGLFDTDGDNRLSIRELRAMPKMVARFDSNKDGGLATTEVPRRFEAALAAGLGSGRSQSPQFVRFGMQNVVQRPQTGPMWFQKMDRNRDGDVSRREFVGTDEHFKKLDADGDGLISEAEAEAAGK